MGKTFDTYYVSHYKTINASRIILSPDITPPVRRHLMGNQSLLNDLGSLQTCAIKAAIAQCPPIAYQAKKEGNDYYCIANVRSLTLSTQLPANEKITIAVIDRPKKQDVDKIILTSEILHDLVFGKKINTLSRTLLNNKKFIDDRHPDVITSISPKLKTKKSFSDMLGINRRLR